MATPVQIGAGAAVLLGVSLGGYAIYSVTTSSGEVKVHTFGRDFKFENTDYKDKLLSLFKDDSLDFLVVPVAKDKDDENRQWWDSAFRNKYGNDRKNTGLDSIFTGIKKGFSEKDNDALNQACKRAYASEKNKYSFADNEFLLKNISEFCTTDNKTKDLFEPKSEVYGNATSNATGEYDWGVLKVPNNGTSLVKAIKNNEYWWKWAYKNLFKDSKTNKDPFIQEINKGYSDTTTDKTLSKACDSAYKKPEVLLSKENDELLKNIQKFCTLGKTEVTLTKPKTPTNVKTVSQNEKKNEEYSGGVALETGNPEKLVDIKDASNQDWWNWAFRNRYQSRESSFQIYEELFNGIEKGYGTEDNDKALNQKCKLAYKKTKANAKSEDKIKKNIDEFCTKDKSKGITVPE